MKRVDILTKYWTLLAEGL